VLEEVERFGTRVLVMTKGRLAASGDFREIRALMDDRPLRLRVRTDAPQALGGALLGAGVVVGVRVEADGGLLVDTRDARRLAHELPRIARAESARLFEIRPLDTDLEGVFRYLVER
jgi:ABC-2 type transport system ATP-binding protein